MADVSRSPAVDIDLDALCANYRSLATQTAPAECAGVVKCDAYGLGAGPVAEALASGGCRTFFVTYPEEGAAVRRRCPASAIYVFNGFRGGETELDLFRRDRLTPVLNSLAEADLWVRFGEGRPAALHIDTGMNRLGAPLSEVASIAALAPDIDLVMSHLACPSLDEHPMNERQRESFERAAALFPGARRSLSASGGALMDARYRCDLVRPGIALYGASPFDARDPRLQLVATLTAPVLQVRAACAGETVGYGATFRAQRDMRLATVALGYGDGYPRAGAGGGAILNGACCPIVGRISMDLIVLDASAAGEVAIGDRAEFYGPNLAIEAAAATAGTIAYELLTGLGRRVVRRYWRNGRLLPQEAP